MQWHAFRFKANNSLIKAGWWDPQNIEIENNFTIFNGCSVVRTLSRDTVVYFYDVLQPLNVQFQDIFCCHLILPTESLSVLTFFEITFSSLTICVSLRWEFSSLHLLLSDRCNDLITGQQNDFLKDKFLYRSPLAALNRIKWVKTLPECTWRLNILI